MSTVYMTIGLPGSGKTTWAKRQAAAVIRPTIIVCRDDLRNMLYSTPWSPENEEFTKTIEIEIVLEGLMSGRDVIMADTNFDPVWRGKIACLSNEVAGIPVVRVPFYTPIETCIERDRKREVGCVGEDVIRKMAAQWNVQENGRFEY